MHALLVLMVNTGSQNQRIAAAEVQYEVHA